MRWLALTVVVLGTSLLANRAAAPQHLLIGLVATAALILIAWRARLTAKEMGLTRWRAGVAWGAAAGAVVAVAYGIAVATNAFDGTTQHGWPTAFRNALLIIPLGTVLPEELAFRGVLLALLRRHHPRSAAAVSSVLFGLWHVLPALGGGAANETLGGSTLARVAGTVLFTALAGLVLTWLRTRSGSLAAPAILHWATNGLGVLAVETA